MVTLGLFHRPIGVDASFLLQPRYYPWVISKRRHLAVSFFFFFFHSSFALSFLSFLVNFFVSYSAVKVAFNVLNILAGQVMITNDTIALVWPSICENQNCPFQIKTSHIHSKRSEWETLSLAWLPSFGLPLGH